MTPLQKLLSDLGRHWRDFKKFVPKALALGDLFGDVVLDAYDLVTGTVQSLVAYGGRAAGGGALIGMTSPVTGGWGFHFLSHSTWATWAPVGVLPVAGMLLRSVFASFRNIDREAEREVQRRLDEHDEPETDRELEEEERLRIAVEGRIDPHGARGPLHNDPVAADTLSEAQARLGGEGFPSDLALVLFHWTKKWRLKMVEAKGPLDDAVRARLALGWDQVIDADWALTRALEPLRYRHASVPFVAGGHHYILVGVSGATIPPRARLEVSRIATRLVVRYADGNELPGRMRE